MTKHEIYTIGSSEAVKLTPNGTHSGMDITLQNVTSSGYIYIGDENVTTSSYGYRIMPNHAISFELPGDDSLFAIGENNSMSLATIKIGLE